MAYFIKSSRFPELHSHVTKIFIAQKSTKAFRVLIFMEIKRCRVKAALVTLVEVIQSDPVKVHNFGSTVFNMIFCHTINSN